MVPSLNELAGRAAAAGVVGIEDAEDMFGKKLTFNDSQPVQKGEKVTVVGVDMDKGTHTVESLRVVRRVIKNDVDVYETVE